MPSNHVWVRGKGWIRKQREAETNYDDMGDGWPLLLHLFRQYPDFFADLVWSDSADFKLSLIQRAFFRMSARYQYVFNTTCRGGTKSFCTDFEEYVEMLMWPGQTSAIIAPSNVQSAQIASQIYKQIENCAPTMTAMLAVEASARDRFVVTTQSGSRVDTGSFRGRTIHKATAEEVAQEEPPPFNADEYRDVVIPAIRAEYRNGGKRPKAYVRYKQHAITSAGRRQSYAYETRKSYRTMMARGESAFIIDVPYVSLILDQIRNPAWAKSIKNELTPASWLREMESVYSGSDKNPLVRDEVLTESRQLSMMEEHHCCKDRDNRIKAEDVIYIVGCDVSYRDAKGNAKCAAVVLKCTKQTDYYHRDKYLKQVVWVEDWSPGETPTPIAQAQRFRRIWDRYTFEGGQSYIALDAWQYGDGVLSALMAEPLGGARPLCCYKHIEKTELELEGAIPVIYPIRAGGVGVRDPDSAMVLNAQMQFEHSNVQLLTMNLAEGVEAYKRYHRVKDDSLDYRIAQPYRKTAELVQQIQNLREEASGQGIKEKRISINIQRDSWSALKYALRMAQILEWANLTKRPERDEWKETFKKAGSSIAGAIASIKMRGVGRMGGRRF